MSDWPEERRSADLARRVAELEVALESMRAGARCFMEALKVFGPGARASWSVGPAEKCEEEP